MRNRFIKRGIAMILIAGTVLATCSCGNKKEEKEDVGKYTSTEIVEKVVSGMNNLPEMKTIKSGDTSADKKFNTLCDVDYGKVEDFTYEYAKDSSKADEVVVIRMKSKSDMAIVKKALEERTEKRVGYFNTYDPSLVPVVEAAQISIKDNYVLYIIGEQAANGKYEFNNMLGK